MSSEKLIPFRDADVLFPDGARPSRQQLHRWASHGTRGRKLRTVRVGARLYTTASAVAEFLRPDDPDDGIATAVVVTGPNGGKGGAHASV